MWCITPSFGNCPATHTWGTSAVSDSFTVSSTHACSLTHAHVNPLTQFTDSWNLLWNLFFSVTFWTCTKPALSCMKETCRKPTRKKKKKNRIRPFFLEAKQPWSHATCRGTRRPAASHRLETARAVYACTWIFLTLEDRLFLDIFFVASLVLRLSAIAAGSVAARQQRSPSLHSVCRDSRVLPISICESEWLWRRTSPLHPGPKPLPAHVCKDPLLLQQTISKMDVAQTCCSLAHYSQTFLAVTPPAEASVTLSASVRAVPSPLSHRLQSQAKTALRTSHLQSCCSLAHYSQTFLAVTPPAEASVTLSVPVHEFHPLRLTGRRAKRKPRFEPHICSHVVHLHTTVRRS